MAMDSTHLVAIGDEVTADFGGSWIRLFPDEENAGDWHFLFGAGGDYNRVTMGDDLLALDQNRQRLTGFNNLDDHSISKCPDGGYFHVGSAGVSDHNDSGYAWRYDKDFEEIGHSTIEEAHATMRFNDMPSVCSEYGTVTVFYDTQRGLSAGHMYTFDDEAQLLDHKEVDGVPYSTEGTTLLEDPFNHDLLMVGTDTLDSTILVARLNWDLDLLESKTVFELEDMAEGRVYWAQAVLAIEDRFVAAYMHQARADGWSSDWGDIWLGIFDQDWNLLESQQITDDPAPDGSMRPGLQVLDDTLLLSYDRIEGSPGYVNPRIRPITLNLAAFQDEGPGDSGDSGDSGNTGDSGTTDSGDKDSGDLPTDDTGNSDGNPPPPPVEEDCGCQALAVSHSWWALLLAGWGLGRRRRHI